MLMVLKAVRLGIEWMRSSPNELVLAACSGVVVKIVWSSQANCGTATVAAPQHKMDHAIMEPEDGERTEARQPVDPTMQVWRTVSDLAACRLKR